MADGSCAVASGAGPLECVPVLPAGGAVAEGILWTQCWPGNEATMPCSSSVAGVISSFWIDGTNGGGCIWDNVAGQWVCTPMATTVSYTYLQPLRQEITLADAAEVGWAVLLTWAVVWGIRVLLARAADPGPENE